MTEPLPSSVRLTHIGGPTLLLEIGRIRILTDPTFDPAGAHYTFGPGISSDKTADPAIPLDAIGALDLVLLSHDTHGDNLDRKGREVLPRAGKVVTTRSAARHLGGNAVGLAPWESLEVGALRITATPARHGPPLSLPFVGEVIGFLLEWPGQKAGALYISGDTVWYRGVAEVAQRVKVGLACLHLGAAGFPLSGPIRYTFDSHGAVEAARAFSAARIVPVHYEGWSHFREGRSAFSQAFEAAGLGERITWLEHGEPRELDI